MWEKPSNLLLCFCVVLVEQQDDFPGASDSCMVWSLSGVRALRLWRGAVCSWCCQGHFLLLALCSSLLNVPPSVDLISVFFLNLCDLCVHQAKAMCSQLLHSASLPLFWEAQDKSPRLFFKGKKLSLPCLVCWNRESWVCVWRKLTQCSQFRCAVHCYVL